MQLYNTECVTTLSSLGFVIFWSVSARLESAVKFTQSNHGRILIPKSQRLCHSHSHQVGSIIEQQATYIHHLPHNNAKTLISLPYSEFIENEANRIMVNLSFSHIIISFIN